MFAFPLSRRRFLAGVNVLWKQDEAGADKRANRTHTIMEFFSIMKEMISR